ncbi:chromosome segregation SMC family protein [Spirochaetota bacterium]
MFIKSLSMAGFKAFADKTKLVFDNGIVALVGPNGCGKSNIVDAIRWVTGEQNIRMLRGDRMEDFIFAGTEERSKSNFAEVEVTIANDNGRLPLEVNEVSVMRRIFRSGDSEFYINRKKVRLKEIHNLFMDTGIGKTAYSVMEQGKIDLILSDKPEDRRYIFEEAAGISRYKTKKHEYDIKIERTNENLIRVSDILKEIEKQYNSLKKQAEKTNLYYTLNDKLKKSEIDFDLFKIQKFKNEKDKVDEKFIGFTKEIEGMTEQIADVNKKIEEITENIQKKEKDTNVMEKDRITVEGKINTAVNRLSIYKENINDIAGSVSFNDNRHKEFEAKRKQLDGDIKSITKELESNKTQYEGMNKSLLEYKKKSGELDTEIGKMQEEIAGFKKRNTEIENERGSLEEVHREIIQKLVDEIDSVKKKISEQKSKVDEERTAIRTYNKGLKQKINDLSKYTLKTISEKDFNKNRDTIGALVDEIYILVKDNASLIDAFVEREDPFYNIIFSGKGTYAKKEDIDNTLKRINEEKNENIKKIESCEGRILKGQGEIGALTKLMQEHEIGIAKTQEILKISHKLRDERTTEINSLYTQIKKAELELSEAQKREKEIQKQIVKEEKVIETFRKDKSKLNINIEDYFTIVQKETGQLRKLEEKHRSKETKLLKTQEIHRELNVKSAMLDRDLENIYSNAYNNYSEDLRGRSVLNREFDPEKLQADIRSYKEELRTIGSVNLMAIDEHKEQKERYDEIQKQKSDILKAKRDLEIISEEINKTSRTLFLENFVMINKNLHRIFRRLFNGGHATLQLTDEKNVLGSGIEILVQPPGKKVQKISLLSGGERALAAISLMFSIFLVRPSPFCLLDEIDAPLDEENIGRVMDLLKEFTTNTQFIIITHSKKTLSIADILYGITMEGGSTKVISLKLDDQSIKKYIQK